MDNDSPTIPKIDFNGPITVNGPMFDIHDNHNVYINTKEPETKNTTSTVNDSLSSPEAMKYWKKLETKGFVDHDCHLMPGVSRMEAMYIARLFSKKLNLEKKWKPFEELWGIKNMAQDNYKKDAYNATVGRERDIDEVFED